MPCSGPACTSAVTGESTFFEEIRAALLSQPARRTDAIHEEGWQAVAAIAAHAEARVHRAWAAPPNPNPRGACRQASNRRKTRTGSKQDLHVPGGWDRQTDR